MRKVLTFLAASLAVALAVPTRAQQAPDMFKDLDRNHWAYEAVESLRSKGIVVGYPDGYFRGRRVLTRYEFAVALDRALRKLNLQGTVGPQGERGPAGETGPPGPQGPPGVTPEELATLRRLLQEFRDELAALGNNMRAIQDRVDRLTRDVADIRDQLNRMPKVHGGAFVGFRSDNTNGAYVDHDGRVNPLNTQQAVVHLFDLGLSANIPGGATLDADVQFDNYRSYLMGTLGRINPTFTPGPNLSTARQSDTRVDRLEINAPFAGLGRGSRLTLGRYHERLGHLTLWRPDVDTYFDVPFVDDGAYRMDGARLTTNFGSVSTEIFGGQLSSVQGTAPGPFNSPVAGSTGAWLIFAGNNKPIGQVYNQFGDQFFGLGPISIDQILGVSLGLNVHQLGGGHVRFTALDAVNRGNSRPATNQFSGVWVLGLDTDLKVAERLTLGLDYGRTTPHRGRLFGSRTYVYDKENNAANFNLGYTSGGLTLTAGYRYIEPLFYAPGYWGRIGNWINPTNIQGPTFRADYTLQNGIGLHVGGDFYTAARDRAVVTPRGSAVPYTGIGGLGKDDEINRILAGIRWGLAKGFDVTADWEGVYWTLKGRHGGIPNLGTGASHPTEQYITIGTGYHLTTNTLLQLAYQSRVWDGHRAVNEGDTGYMNSSGVFTAQASVRF